MSDLNLRIDWPVGRPLRILCLGAHCDDVDIGCGGTLLKLLRMADPVDVTWVAFSAPANRAKEFRSSAARFLRRAEQWKVITYEFRDSFFPAQYAAIKESFQTLRDGFDPDIIFTHSMHDRHQDHRIVSELTWTAFRRHLILEYEVPQYDRGLEPPNAYVQLGKREVGSKIRILMSCYPSQSAKQWFTEDTFRGLMRLRGIECAADAGWAEGFHARKISIC